MLTKPANAQQYCSYVQVSHVEFHLDFTIKMESTDIYICAYGPGSSVGIATNYGLDGPESNSGGDEIFCLSRPALGPTQPPVQWVPALSRG